MGTGQVPGQSQHILQGFKMQELPRLQKEASGCVLGGDLHSATVPQSWCSCTQQPR